MSPWTEGELIEEGDAGLIRKEMKLLWLIWAGNFMTVPVLLSVCLLSGEKVRENVGGNPEMPMEFIRVLLGAVGVVSLAVSYYLRKMIFAGKLSAVVNSIAKNPGMVNLPAYLIRYRMAVLFCCAAGSVPVIMGFLIYVLGGHVLMLYILAGLSALSIFYYRPKEAEIAELRRSM